MNLDIPLQRVFIPIRFLTKENTDKSISGYWYGISLLPDRIIGCHVTLEDGANWSRLPLHYLRLWDEALSGTSPEDVQVYDCFSYHGEVTRYNFLRGQSVEFLHKTNIVGEYLFTVDYHSPDWSSPYAEDVEQHKQHHIFACDDGFYRARPNNFVKWIDPSLYHPFEKTPKYKRLTEKFSSEDSF